MADQGADARSDRDLPILAGTARHPGRHLCLIPAYRILGRMGRRLGLYLPEFRDRRGARRALRPSRRSAAGERYILRREPRRDRPDPAFLLPAGETGHGRLAAMGDRSRLPGRHRRLASRGGIAVHRRRHRWRSVLRGFVPCRPPAALQITALPVLTQLAPVASGSTLGKLLLFFLKAGSLTFGSGLVIVPFLEQGLVREYGWLDPRQFLVAVAIGMISPGPVVITATFVGYLV